MWHAARIPRRLVIVVSHSRRGLFSMFLLFEFFTLCVYYLIYLYGHPTWLAATYFPAKRSNLCPLRWKHRVLTTGGVCSVAKSYPTLSDPLDWSISGFPVLHHLPEFAQTHVPWVGDAIQPHSVTPFFYLQSFTASGSFPMSQFLCITWAKCWSFSISPSNENSGLISLCHLI